MHIRSHLLFLGVKLLVFFSWLIRILEALCPKCGDCALKMLGDLEGFLNFSAENLCGRAIHLFLLACY